MNHATAGSAMAQKADSELGVEAATTVGAVDVGKGVGKAVGLGSGIVVGITSAVGADVATSLGTIRVSPNSPGVGVGVEAGGVATAPEGSIVVLPPPRSHADMARTNTSTTANRIINQAVWEVDTGMVFFAVMYVRAGERQNLKVSQCDLWHTGPLCSQLTSRTMDVDPLLVVYQGIAARIIAIATAVAPEDLDSPVPACSGWTARQVVAHLAGLCEDWDAGIWRCPGTRG